MLFQRFDRLLFLAKGGRTVYFGEVGKNASVLTKYFERNGAFACPEDANPAEWMLEAIGAAPGSSTEVDWHSTWRDSPEYKEVQRELQRLKEERPQITEPSASPADKASYREFAAPFTFQLWEVTKRVFVQYWRTPSYIYSKALLCVSSVRCCLYSPLRILMSLIFIRHYSLVSLSSMQGPVDKSCRTKCLLYSCSSRYLVS